MQVAAQVADRIDADLPAQRFEQVQVGVGPAADSGRIAEQLAGEGERCSSLADTARAVEEIGVRGAFG